MRESEGIPPVPGSHDLDQSIKVWLYGCRTDCLRVWEQDWETERWLGACVCTQYCFQASANVLLT